MKLMDSHNRVMVDSHLDNIERGGPHKFMYSTKVTVQGSRAWSLEGMQELRRTYALARLHAQKFGMYFTVYFDQNLQVWDYRHRSEVNHEHS